MGLMTIRVKVKNIFEVYLLRETTLYLTTQLYLGQKVLFCPTCLPDSGECGNNTSQPNWQLWFANWAELGNNLQRFCGQRIHSVIGSENPEIYIGIDYFKLFTEGNQVAIAWFYQTFV